MKGFTQPERINAATTLSIVFPTLTYIIFAVSQFIPTVGALAHAAFFFGSPILWIFLYFSEPGRIHGLSPESLAILTWGHYPVFGLFIGFFYPFELSRTRECLKQLLSRYGAFVAFYILIGISLAMYAVAHDS